MNDSRANFIQVNQLDQLMRPFWCFLFEVFFNKLLKSKYKNQFQEQITHFNNLRKDESVSLSRPPKINHLS
jgi:hypothetical protein